MVKQKNIFLFFSVAFISISIVMAKNVSDRKLFEKINLSSYEIDLKQESSSQQNHHSSVRNQTDYYLNTFDSNSNEWTIDEGWLRTDYNFHSPEHSINSIDNNQSLSQLWQITSPIYTLPIQPPNETIHYSFWLRNDMLDGDGNGDTYLDDFFSLSLLLEDDGIWNTTNFNSFDGLSYWCGDEELDGYGDTWVQYLDTPEVILQPDSELTAMMKWAIEDAEGAVEENIEAICENGDNAIDGWDQVNVQISTDSGSTWDILVGNDLYDFQCGYGTVYNGFNGLPGWSGVQDWHEVTFDLSQYANQNIIIRFAFYSDPSWSTIDDDILTGLQIDDIQIISHNVMFEDNADNPQMNGSGENWVEQLYDYWDDGSISGTESPQPGSLVWEEYKPGTAFDGNILQNLTEFAGRDIKFRFQAFFDGNNDGGQGSGLFIDDFRIYSESTEFYPPPSNLTVENDDDVKLTWSDLLNHEGDYLHIIDSGENAIFYETTLECQTSEDCITYMGNLFYIHGNSSVDSVYIFNKNEADVEITIAAFSTIGQLFNPDTTYSRTVTLTQSNSWNGFSVDGWNFTNPYIIAHTITDEISISLDTETSSYGAFFDGSSWDSRETGDAYYTTGIRAKITKEDSNVTYNVYRIDESNNDFIRIATSLTDSTYIDSTVIELEEYTYGVSATYPEDNQESVILINPESISILPSSYQELSWDDGNFESNFELEQYDSLAIKFRASSLGQQVVRFKWYQSENGGHVKLMIWDNSENGTPNMQLYSKLLTTDYAASEGWNEYDLSEQNWSVSGDFWIGIIAYSNTSPIAIDYDEGSNSSMYKTSNSEWSIINDWNVGIRIFLDCAGSIIDECGVCNGDNSSCTDCAGEVNGNAIIDECGNCGGDNSTCSDCAGVPNGTSIFDECGICGGSGPIDECGCDDIPIGFCDCSENTFDECEVCGGNNSSCLDECGIPNGDNTSCTGCMHEEYTEYDPLATIPCEDNTCCLTLENSDNFIPSKFEIVNLYPNPFNPQINIEYSLPTTSNVKVSIYNVQGQEVARLIDAMQSTGFHSLTWIATEVNSGIYFVQITANSDIINRKIMYLK